MTMVTLYTLLTTKTDTIKIIPEEWQWEVKL